MVAVAALMMSETPNATGGSSSHRAAPGQHLMPTQPASAAGESPSGDVLGAALMLHSQEVLGPYYLMHTGDLLAHLAKAYSMQVVP